MPSEVVDFKFNISAMTFRVNDSNSVHFVVSASRLVVSCNSTPRKLIQTCERKSNQPEAHGELKRKKVSIYLYRYVYIYIYINNSL